MKQLSYVTNAIRHIEALGEAKQEIREALEASEEPLAAVNAAIEAFNYHVAEANAFAAERGHPR